MEFFKPDINIDFIGKRQWAYILSLVMVGIGFFSLVLHNGPRYGIDFAGGTLIQVQFPAAVAIGDIHAGLADSGLSAAAVQTFGEATEHEFLIRAEAATQVGDQFAQRLAADLQAATGQPAEIRRVEMVGPQVGKELQEKALFAMFFALLFITIYISGRFEFKWLLSGVIAAAMIGAVYLVALFDVSVAILIFVALAVSLVLFWFLELKYAMGAIVALLHDVFITVGLFSLFGKEFTLPIIAALLTIIGYSLNDTIIVFDRIRENQRKHHRKPFDFIINRSINDVLNRTILTSGTTLVVVVALYLLGGGIIQDFAFALIAGVMIGTYSSIYVASPILLAWQRRAARRA